jgi:hypothetical protein
MSSTGDIERELEDLAARVRAEGRAERRQVELEAVRERWRSRRFVEAVQEAMRRGDEVTVVLPGGRKLQGLVVDAGVDFATLWAAGRGVSVHLSAGVQSEFGDPYQPPLVMVTIRRRSRSGGTNPSRRTPSFQALLHQYDFEQRYLRPGRYVEVGTLLERDPVVGRIEVHAWDHLYLRTEDGSEVFVPVAAITTIAWAERPG